jgi:hypothetical protein
MNPSLALLPCAFDPAKLYSVLPDTGAGDFTVSRNGTATFLGANGLIQTAQANEPRLEFNADGSFRGVLVEPAATNLLLRSEEFDNTYWSKVNGPVIITQNQIASPDGQTSADLITIPAVVDARMSRGSLTLLNSTSYTLSFFVKNLNLTTGQTFRILLNNNTSSPNNFDIRAVVNIAAGTVVYTGGGTSGTGITGTGNASISSLPNGWFRIILTGTTGTSAASTTASVEVDSQNLERAFYIWGAQLEVGSVATSYIPTVATAITRPADIITRTNAQDLIGQSEGSLYAEINLSKLTNNFFRNIITIGNWSALGFALIIDNPGANSQAFGFYGRFNNANIFTPITTTSLTMSNFRNHKLLVVYKQNEFSLFWNGVLVAKRTAGSYSGSMADISLHTITGLSSAQSGTLNDNLRSLCIFKTALTDAQAIALTTL